MSQHLKDDLKSLPAAFSRGGGLERDTRTVKRCSRHVVASGRGGVEYHDNPLCALQTMSLPARKAPLQRKHTSNSGPGTNKFKPELLGTRRPAISAPRPTQDMLNAARGKDPLDLVRGIMDR